MPNADRIIEVLHEAKARPAGPERDGFIEHACRDDAALKDQILSLLRAEAQESESDFLHAIPVTREAAHLTEKLGDRIGRFKLLEQIGEGGCGVVYMADQEQPVRRRVALKVIKLGMDTRKVIARFEAERQALAMMDHPNIAKVFDGGATETGRPYFVMELVRGIKVTDYCDQHRLPTEQRLALFIQVCQAVQHAHQKGIIHRDLKPSNILVTVDDNGVPVPKVIDFGIAKATDQRLTEHTAFTALEQFIGTPAYMSPEQAGSRDVDTRTDVYSLGVVLYELLTGNTPFCAKKLVAAGVEEMRRRIREDEPARPSNCLSTLQGMDLTTVCRHRQTEPPKLIHLICGDLDWLVMKCLEKDRARRYQTANALATDLQRHLNEEPILACPPSRSYRLQKMVKRNKLACVAGAAVAIALIAGFATSFWLYLGQRAASRMAEKNALRADEQAQRATAEARKSQQVSGFLLQMLKGVGPSMALGRDTTMLREILDGTEKRLSELHDQPRVEAEMRATLGDVYCDLGEYPKAILMHRRALEIRKKLLGNRHADVAKSLSSLGDALAKHGQDVEAEAMHREALEIRLHLFGEDDLDVADSCTGLGMVLEEQGELEAAEKMASRAFEICFRVLGPDAPRIAVALHDLAWKLHLNGRRGEAEELSRRELEILRKAEGTNPMTIVNALADLSVYVYGQRRTDEARDIAREALKIAQEHSSDAAGLAAPLLRSPSRTAWFGGELEEVGELYLHELTMRRKVLGPNHPEVATSLLHLSAISLQQGKAREAEAAAMEAIAIQRARLGEKCRSMIGSLQCLADALRHQHRFREAESALREKISILREHRGKEHAQVADALHQLGINLLEQGKSPDAEVIFEQLLELKRTQFGSESHQVATVLRWLTTCLQKQGKAREAEAIDREEKAIQTVGARRHLVAMRHAHPRRDHKALQSALVTLGECLRAAGNLTEAEEMFREAVAVERKLPASEQNSHALQYWVEVLRVQGKICEAEVTLDEGLAIHRARPTKDLPRIGRLLGLLGLCLQDRGQEEDAKLAYRQQIETFQQVLATLREKNDTKNPFTFVGASNSLGVCLDREGQHENAAAVHLEGIMFLQEERKRDRISYDRYLNMCAPFVEGSLRNSLAAHRFGAVEAPARQYLDLMEADELQPPQLFVARSILGAALSGQKRFLEAESLLLSGYRGLSQAVNKITPPRRAQIRDALERIVNFYQQSGAKANEAVWRRQLEAFGQESEGGSVATKATP